MILLIVSILSLVAALVLALYGRKKLAEATRTVTLAEQTRDVARALVESAREVQDEAKHERELAGALLAHVQKLEDSLVNPRFALNLKTGRIRALRYGEEPQLVEEVKTRDPDPDCRKCFGRGWSGRARETGAVIPCPCVRRRG